MLYAFHIYINYIIFTNLNIRLCALPSERIGEFVNTFELYLKKKVFKKNI